MTGDQEQEQTMFIQTLESNQFPPCKWKDGLFFHMIA
jgi:hypothetical protein